MLDAAVAPVSIYDSARSFAELRDMFLADMARSGYGQVMISGPITTGGYNDSQKNLDLFAKTIRIHREIGKRVVDIIPLERSVQRLRLEWHMQGRVGEYCMPILEVLYAGIIRSGLISKGIFIPGYQSSVGSCWERQELQAMGAQIEDLPEEWLDPAFRDQYRSEMIALLAA